MSHDPHRPAPSRVALVTGVGRRRSIGAELALGLAADGWDLALGHWQPYDERLGYERGEDDPAAVAEECRALGSRVELLPGDLADPADAGSARRGGDRAARSGHRPRHVALRVGRQRDPHDLARELGPALRRQRPRHVAAHPRVRRAAAGAGAGRACSGPRRGPDERPHRAQPALRLEQGRARPHRHRGGARARRPRRAGQRRSTPAPSTPGGWTTGSARSAWPRPRPADWAPRATPRTSCGSSSPRPAAGSTASCCTATVASRPVSDVAQGATGSAVSRRWKAGSS